MNTHFCIFFLANSYEPLVVFVLNHLQRVSSVFVNISHVTEKTGVISREKKAVSLPEIAGEF